MRLTVLGSGTTVPDPQRGPCGLLVEVGMRAFLIDGGSGTLQRCVKAGVDPRTLAGGLYSHTHPDHCADLVPLLFAMRVGPPPRQTDYPIWAGQGFAAFFDKLKAAWGASLDLTPGAVSIREMSLDGPDEADLDGAILRTRPANHSASALHLRIEADGRSVVFSGDTGPSDHLTELARGADLLVCECAGTDESPMEGHLTPSAVAAIVDEAKPLEVWLTHFYPGTNPTDAVSTVARTGVVVRRASDLDTWE